MNVYVVVLGADYSYPEFKKAFENYNDALKYKKKLELNNEFLIPVIETVLFVKKIK